MNDHRFILVTGATGYVGGQLIPYLLEQGYAVRVLARETARLKDFAWSSRVQVSIGDMLQADTLTPALSGVDIGWFSCVLGAAWNSHWLSVLIVPILGAIHLTVIGRAKLLPAILSRNAK